MLGCGKDWNVSSGLVSDMSLEELLENNIMFDHAQIGY